jgi:ankyrin repeat protein
MDLYRFRWIVCQLKVLMNTLPPAVARALANLPQGLDETYDRILEGISQQSQDFAQRLFACLAASFRPLRIEELAEILAIDWDDGEVPNYDKEWRPQDPEEAVLSACSSLIAIVNVNGSRIVQFSHFSVKEYLTSERLKTSEKLSQFHITPHSAHTILAQASLSILLALEDTASKMTMMDCPFATYAARHWVDHARFENVSTDITDAMKRLFDPTESHFAAWVWIYDIDHPLRETMSTEHPTPPKAVPLYYATLCGFRGIVGHLIDTYPEDVNATGGLHGTPLHAAIVKGNTDIMMFLLENKGDTALNLARLDGELDAARMLQRYGTSVGPPSTDGWASMNAEPRYEHRDIVRMLLKNGAMVDSRNNDGSTPLMTASRYGHLDIVDMLLDHEATVDSQDNDGWTPLMLASGYGHPKIVGVLLEHGATVDLSNNDGWTPLLSSSQYGYPDVVRLLLKHDANVDSRGNNGWAPLIAASRGGYMDIVGMLLEKGVTVETRTLDGWSPLMEASRYGHSDIVRLLLKTSPDLESRNNYGSTPLKLAAFGGHLDNTRLLLEKGGDADTCDNAGWTPLMEAAELGHLKVIRLLIEKGATVDSLHEDRSLLPDGASSFLSRGCAAVS